MIMWLAIEFYMEVICLTVFFFFFFINVMIDYNLVRFQLYIFVSHVVGTPPPPLCPPPTPPFPW